MSEDEGEKKAKRRALLAMGMALGMAFDMMMHEQEELPIAMRFNHWDEKGRIWHGRFSDIRRMVRFNVRKEGRRLLADAYDRDGNILETIRMRRQEM